MEYEDIPESAMQRKPRSRSHDFINVLLKPKAIEALIKKEGVKLRSKWRKFVTGDGSKRIRDHLREHEGRQETVVSQDKLAFTFGVLNVVACQYFLLNRTDVFWRWYSLTLPLVLIARFFLFRKLGWQYFMLDFCYFTIACTFANLYLFWGNETFFKICFIYANGPLTWAIVAWRNSLVFHDYDRTTSVYIHILPSMLTYSLRWTPGYYDTCSGLMLRDFAMACSGYMAWQLMYYMKTEVFDKSRLDDNPCLITSLRWLSADKKNAMARAVLKLLRAMGVFGKEEDFDSTTVKTKLVFISSQLMYTIVTFLPVPLFFYWRRAHIMFILFIFATSVYYGAGYYFEVFSRRYHQKFESKDKIKQVAQAAAEIAYQLAARQQGVTTMMKTKVSSVKMNNNSEGDDHHHHQHDHDHDQLHHHGHDHEPSCACADRHEDTLMSNGSGRHHDGHHDREIRMDDTTSSMIRQAAEGLAQVYMDHEHELDQHLSFDCQHDGDAVHESGEHSTN